MVEGSEETTLPDSLQLDEFAFDRFSVVRILGLVGQTGIANAAVMAPVSEIYD